MKQATFCKKSQKARMYDIKVALKAFRIMGKKSTLEKSKAIRQRLGSTGRQPGPGTESAAALGIDDPDNRDDQRQGVDSGEDGEFARDHSAAGLCADAGQDRTVPSGQPGRYCPPPGAECLFGSSGLVL